MIAGEVVMHHQWNGASHRTKEKLPTAVYVYPKEGVSFWMDNFAVVKGAPHLEEAKTFINWMLKPGEHGGRLELHRLQQRAPAAQDLMDAALRTTPRSSPQGDTRPASGPARLQRRRPRTPQPGLDPAEELGAPDRAWRRGRVGRPRRATFRVRRGSRPER
jgi:spermidine/putrescine-binding protein